jgi:hypothetical protein
MLHVSKHRQKYAWHEESINLNHEEKYYVYRYTAGKNIG